MTGDRVGARVTVARGGMMKLIKKERLLPYPNCICLHGHHCHIVLEETKKLPDGDWVPVFHVGGCVVGGCDCKGYQSL